MDFTLFPEFFNDKLKETAGILSGPLSIAGKILQNPDFDEIQKSIENDQRELSKSRAAARNREFKEKDTNKHPPAELVVALFIGRHFYGKCFGKRGYEMLCENSSLQQFIARLGIATFPSRSTIHEQVSMLSENSLRLFHQAILKCVKDSELDDFSAVIIDSTAVEADSAWPVDSLLLKKLSRKTMSYLNELHSSLSSIQQRQIPIQRLQNYCNELSLLDFEISMLKGKKGARKMRKKLYTEQVLVKSRKFIQRFDVIFSRLEAINTNSAVLNKLKTSFERFVDKTLMVEHRFHIAPDQYEPKSARKIYSMSDDDASFIKKGGRETVFGYRPNFACSANGFISAFHLEKGNTSDSKAFESTLNESKNMTKTNVAMVSVDDGYTSLQGLNNVIDQGCAIVSFSGSKGKKLLGEEIYNSEQYKEARNLRSISEAVISKLKNSHELDRFRVCGLKRVRQETFIAVIGFNLERFCQLLSQNQIQKAA